MSKQINDGGPAFPILPVGTGDPRDGMSSGSDGMSLRDWFAGMALQGFCSMADSTGGWQWGINDATKTAYEVADAMLAERNKPKDL